MKRVLVTAALLLALGGTATVLASRAAPSTEKVLGAAGISRRSAIHGSRSELVVSTTVLGAEANGFAELNGLYIASRRFPGG
jgi:hypothetical protein